MHAGQRGLGERPAQPVEFGRHARFGDLDLAAHDALGVDLGRQHFALLGQLEALGGILEDARPGGLRVLSLLAGKGLGLLQQRRFQLAYLGIRIHQFSASGPKTARTTSSTAGE